MSSADIATVKSNHSGVDFSRLVPEQAEQPDVIPDEGDILAGLDLIDSNESRSHFRKTEAQKQPQRQERAVETIKDSVEDLTKLQEESPDEYGLVEQDPDEISTFLKKTEHNFGDKARRNWSNIIGQYQADFNRSRNKNSSLILSKEGNDKLKAIFDLLNFTSEDDESNLRVVQNQARELVNSIVRDKSRNLSNTIGPLDRENVQDLLSAKDDSAAMKAILNLVQNVGIEDFNNPNKGFLRKLSRAFGPQLGENVSSFVNTRVNQLLSKPLTPELREVLEDNNLTDKYDKIKTEFFEQIKTKIDKNRSKFDRRVGDLKTEHQNIYDERVKKIEALYMADETEVQDKLADLIKDQAKLDFEAMRNSRMLDLAKTTVTDLNTAASRREAQTLTVSGKLLTNNEVKRQWLISEFESARKVISQEAPNVGAYRVKEVLTKAKQEISKNGGLPVQIEVEYPVNTATKITLDEGQINHLLNHPEYAGQEIKYPKGDGPFTIGDPPTTSTGHHAFNNARDLINGIVARQKTIETKNLEAQQDKAFETIKEISKAIPGLGFAAVATSVASMKTSMAAPTFVASNIGSASVAELEKAIEGANLKQWDISYDGKTTSQKDLLKKVANQIKVSVKDFRDNERYLEKLSRELDKAVATPFIKNAKNVGLQLLYGLNENLADEEGYISNNLEEAFASQADEISTDYVSELEHKANLSKTLAQGLYNNLDELNSGEKNITIKVGSASFNTFEDALEALFKKGNLNDNIQDFIELVNNLSEHDRANFKISDTEREELLNDNYDGLNPAERLAKQNKQKALLIAYLQKAEKAKAKLPKVSSTGGTPLFEQVNNLGFAIPSRKVDIQRYQNDVLFLTKTYENQVEKIKDAEDMLSKLDKTNLDINGIMENDDGIKTQYTDVISKVLDRFLRLTGLKDKQEYLSKLKAKVNDEGANDGNENSFEEVVLSAINKDLALSTK